MSEREKSSVRKMSFSVSTNWTLHLKLVSWEAQRMGRLLVPLAKLQQKIPPPTLLSTILTTWKHMTMCTVFSMLQ